jgi:hypothetical protein
MLDPILDGAPVPPHSNPTASRPLYNPWFMASTAEEAETSGVIVKIRRPTGWSQKNISSTRKPR